MHGDRCATVAFGEIVWDWARGWCLVPDDEFEKGVGSSIARAKRERPEEQRIVANVWIVKEIRGAFRNQRRGRVQDRSRHRMNGPGPPFVLCDGSDG